MEFCKEGPPVHEGQPHQLARTRTWSCTLAVVHMRGRALGCARGRNEGARAGESACGRARARVCFGLCWDHVWIIIEPRLGHVLTMFGPCLGHIWFIFRPCLDHVSTMFRPCLGLIMTMFGSLLGHVWAMFLPCLTMFGPGVDFNGLVRLASIIRTLPHYIYTRCAISM
jgi:hypothetical protein